MKCSHFGGGCKLNDSTVAHQAQQAKYLIVADFPSIGEKDSTSCTVLSGISNTLINASVFISVPVREKKKKKAL